MSAFDNDLLPLLLAFPTHVPLPESVIEAEYDLHMKKLLHVLNSTPAVQLAAGEQDGTTSLLEVLNPTVNSLAYLYALLAHAQCSPYGMENSAYESHVPVYVEPGGPLWEKMTSFLQVFDPRQVQYAGAEWKKLVEIVARSARRVRKPSLAVRPLREAILRLDPTSSTLTSSHVLFAKLCVEARALHPALPILDRDISAFPVQGRTPPVPTPREQSTESITINLSSGLSDRLSHSDPLSYHLHGAMIYMGLKKWERAVEFLRCVIAAPATGAPSLIQIEAYKKWILANLICKGSEAEAKGQVPKLARRAYYHNCGPAYTNIAELFMKGDIGRLRREVDAARTVWVHDCNAGLISQTLEAFSRFVILRLEEKYSTVATRQICERHPDALSGRPSSPDQQELELEQRLLSMIASGQLRATLSYPSLSSTRAVLNFAAATDEDETEFTPPSQPSTFPAAAATSSVEPSMQGGLLEHIDAQIEHISGMNAQLKDLNNRARLNKEYITTKQRYSKYAKDARFPGEDAAARGIAKDWSRIVPSIMDPGPIVDDHESEYQLLLENAQVTMPDEDVMADI